MVGTKLKSAVVIFIVLFYLYIDGVQKNMNTWKDEREYCIAGLGTCENPLYEYDVLEPHSICYYRQSDGDTRLCSQSHHQDNVMCAADYNYSQRDFSNVYGNTAPASYFLHDTGIIVVCCLILTFSALFDRRGSAVDMVEDEEGAFYQRDNINMLNVIFLLELILIILMLWSGFMFNFMQPVNCPLESVLEDDEGRRNMCISLADCSTGMRSIINPSHFAVRYYRGNVFTMVAVFAAAMFARVIINREKSRNHAEIAPSEMLAAIDAMERADREDRERRSVEDIVAEYDNQLRASGRSGDNRGRYNILGRHRNNGSGGGFVLFDTHFTAGTDPFAAYMDQRNDAGSDESSSEDGGSDSGNDGEGTMTSHIQAMISRQNLMRKWQYYEVSNVIMSKKLCSAVKEQGECAICLCSLLPDENSAPATSSSSMTSRPNGVSAEGNDLMVIQVPCSHWFHRNCLLKWVVSSQRNDSGGRTCPVCRARLSNGKQHKTRRSREDGL